MPAVRHVEAADVVHRPSIDPHVLGVQVEELVAKLVERPERIHALKHEMRGVVVEAERRRVDVGERPPPDGRRGHQVLAPRPFIAGEQHRAVLDPDPHAPLRGVPHERPPGLEEPRPVVVDGSCPVAAHERVDGADAEQRRGLDHPPQLGDGHAGHGRVWIERIGVVAEPADRHAVPVAGGPHRRGLGGREVGHVDVGDAGVLPLRGPDRPAHQLDAGEALGRREREHVVEGQFGKDRGDESELHGDHLPGMGLAKCSRR